MSDIEKFSKGAVTYEKIITAAFCTALALCTNMTAHAAENLDRDYIEAEIWEDMWNGKDDNGFDYPEASYKHHLLEKWLDENYGSDDYDWSEIGELKYEYKNYYSHLIEDWDFEDDDNGGWTIDTENNQPYGIPLRTYANQYGMRFSISLAFTRPRRFSGTNSENLCCPVWS